MKKIILAFVFAIVALFAVSPASNVAKASPETFKKVTPLAPLSVGGTNAFGTFAGTFTIQKFVAKGGQLVAVGSLTGTYTDVLGIVTQITNQIIGIPVTSITGTCQILHLVLGPVDLNLLGLKIHLDMVVLDITAQEGSGKLLGNLLCAVAHLLDSGGSLGTIAKLLNEILAILP